MTFLVYIAWECIWLDSSLFYEQLAAEDAGSLTDLCHVGTFCQATCAEYMVVVARNGLPSFLNDCATCQIHKLNGILTTAIGCERNLTLILRRIWKQFDLAFMFCQILNTGDTGIQDYRV